jgi:hypothetical protein
MVRYSSRSYEIISTEYLLAKAFNVVVRHHSILLHYITPYVTYFFSKSLVPGYQSALFVSHCPASSSSVGSSTARSSIQFKNRSNLKKYKKII